MAAQEWEGTWEEVRQEFEHLPFDKTQRVRIVATGDEADTTPAPSQPITFGMFSELGRFDDEDFKSAEFHGDADDGL